MKINHGEFREGRHYFPVKVYYSDTDAGGVVYHSNYLNFAEHARTEMIDHLGVSQRHHIEETGAGFVVSSINIKYKRPALLDDHLVIETLLTRCERFTLNMEQRIWREDQELAQMEIRIAYIGLSDGKPRPIPEPWKQALEDLLP